MSSSVKVFINDKLLALSNDQGLYRPKECGMFLRFHSEEELRVAIEAMETQEKVGNMFVFHENLQGLWNIFKSGYFWKEAAGGLVSNMRGEWLFIFRRGRWDLPKGGIEPGETPGSAALREVQEECGLKNISVVRLSSPTYHTYGEDDKKFLKKTHWFLMAATGDEALIPCTGEEITEVKWFSAGQLQPVWDNTYLSIRDVIAKANIR